VALDIHDQRILALLDEDAELEQLATGFTFTEGPIWVQDGGYLLFADVPAQQRFRWDEASGVRLVAAETRMGNGMTLDREGRLVVCEGETGIVRMDATGTGSRREVLVSGYDGLRLNSPNDVVVHSSGAIYFTDPWWLDRLGSTVQRELDFQGVYRLVEGGDPELLVIDMDFPNGLCFSPDETILYVNDSTPGRIRAFALLGDGSLGAEHVFADRVTDATGHVDGMKCDQTGNIWVTGPGGVWVFDAEGTLLGVLQTPARTGNLHWGGPDWSWMFIASTTGIYRVRTRTRGGCEPFMRC
jgi:gluconolactonase